MKIASLLPSATEILCVLGLQEDLVGVTHECDFPPGVERLPKVTRSLIPNEASSAEIDTLVRKRLLTRAALYELDLPVLKAQAPALLVTQALCDVCAVAEAEVQEAACRLPSRPQVLNLEPTTLEEVFEAILQVGAATGRQVRAAELVAGYRARVSRVAVRSAALLPTAGEHGRVRVAFLEWLAPLFAAGHWTPALVALAGGQDVLGRAGERSRVVSLAALVAAQPEVLFIACCGFDVARTLQDLPLLQAQPGFAALPAVQAGRVYLADGGAYFSRPGPRLCDALEMLAHALYPAVHPAPAVCAQRITFS